MMEDKLRAYMDHLFREVPQTSHTVEIKEEILQNLVDKYHDMLKEGKTEDAAYNIAVASIGDVSEIVESLKEKKQGGINQMDEESRMKAKRRSAMFVSVAVMLYIMCVVPVIIADAMGMNEIAGVCFMFIMIAVATGLIIYNNMTKPSFQKMDDTMMEDFKEWKHQTDSKHQAMKSIKGAMWSIITVIYFVVSFATGAWYITWVIFLIGGAAESIIRAVFDLKE